jgi:hypothetical protein
MGADGCWSTNTTQNIYANRKLFSRIIGNEPALFGYSIDPQIAQILQYDFDFPELDPNISFIEYLCSDFKRAFREKLDENRCFVEESGETQYMNGHFLIGYKNEIYLIEGNLQALQIKRDFHCIGCGYAEATGAMEAMNDTLPPKNKIEWALSISAKYNKGVSEPFEFLEI